MELSSYSFALLSFFLLISCCLGLNKSPVCHKEEESALLQFKQSFTLDLSDSSCLGAANSSILPSWKIEGSNGNCCSWNGIECDRDTSFVIGLDLSHSCLFGSIDSKSSLFRLLHLQKLSLSGNNFNYSEIPEAIGQLYQLRHLDLSSSQFSGQIPIAISKLHSLTILDLSWNIDLSSEKPLLKLRNPDLGDLILNLTSIEKLHLSKVNISSVVPNVLANFSSLKFLYMADCRLQGIFPEKIFQLKKLEHVMLLMNPSLHGHLPEFNTTNSLQMLSLSGSGFYGRLPFTIGNLLSLNTLFINDCNFSGSIPFSLGNLTNLKTLGLLGNKFSGQIPSSFQNLATLNFLALSYNDNLNDTTSLPWLGKLYELKILSLSEMNLRHNVLPSIQNLTSLMFLGLDGNFMAGILPQWFGNFSRSMKFLELRNNMFRGSIPDSFKNQNRLLFMDLSNHQRQGQLPRSLSSCHMLEALVLSNNQLNDVFPSWLGTLPNLRVLVLGSNQFYGDIGEPKTNSEFSQLHVIDLSHNKLYGNLPVKYISNWNAMKTFPSFSACIMNISVQLGTETQKFIFSTPISIINKGSHRFFVKIIEDFSFIDLSCNVFEGEIPYFIGDLKWLQSLNLSYNKLTGQIPSSLGNLKQLEVLDLSHNRLFGNIPQELSQPTFLEILNVSYNNLSGQLPHGPQLDTMDNSSYVGNPNLCGKPLSKECGQDSEAKEMPSQISEEEDQKSFFKFGWQIVLIGHGCGLVFGMVLGNCVFTRNQDWLLKTFKVAPNRRRGKRMRHKNNRLNFSEIVTILINFLCVNV